MRRRRYFRFVRSMEDAADGSEYVVRVRSTAPWGCVMCGLRNPASYTNCQECGQARCDHEESEGLEEWWPE